MKTSSSSRLSDRPQTACIAIHWARMLGAVWLSVMLLTSCGQGDQFTLDRPTSTFPNAGDPCAGFTSRKQKGGSSITVAGTVQYEDRLYDSQGFTGTVQPKFVRFADVEVVSCAKDPTDTTAVVASGQTNEVGMYSIGPFSNASNASGLYVRVLARSQPVSNLHIVVRNNTLQKAIQAIVSPPFDDSTGTSFVSDITATAASRLGGLFNILDVSVEAAQYVTGLVVGGAPVRFPASTALTIYWEVGTDDGTYFDPSDRSIHLLGSLLDTDEYDDDVILHEYGHFMADVFSQDDSPGGSHFLTDHTQDIRLAWSEGWATFFSAAVRGNPLLVDTIAGGASAFEINTPSFASTAIYTTNELAVSTVLWHLLTALGSSDIWDVFAHRLPAAATVSMEAFWDGWFGVGGFASKGHQTTLEGITAERLMAFVANASPLPLVVGRPAAYTLYATPGESATLMVTFPATTASHTVKTFNLGNGADTFLEVFPNAACIGQQVTGSPNDNGTDTTNYSRCGTQTQPPCPANNDTNLASTITFAATAGQHCIRVSRSPQAPPSAGFYGSFNLQVTSP